jgi:hypothetical protein
VADETRTNAEDPQAATLTLRDQGADTNYANTCVLTSTAEEVIMNFALNIQPVQRDGSVEMRVNSRVIMTYPSAKRLALTLSQLIQRYEGAHGVIRLDRAGAMPTQPATGQAAGQPEQSQ